jgi:glycosyltransferase involved in cell wall biosynthesis
MAADPPARIRLIGLIAGGYSGIPRYAVRLARALDNVAGDFPELAVTLVTTERGAAEIEPRRLELELVRGPLRHANAGPARLAAEQVAAARGRADLLFFFDVMGPLLAPRRPFVAVAHDARPAHAFIRRRWAYKRRLYPWVTRHAEALVAVSRFAADEMVEHFGADRARIRVVHSGPGLETDVPPRGDGTNAGRPFLLYLGALEANKNLGVLVEAHGRADADIDLVLAGRPGSGFEELRAQLDASPAAGRIRIEQAVDDRRADELYRTALALAHPARYEGFGFTPLEAMARGCPVLESDIPALREISGDGALLVPLEDVAAWADAIRRVATDGELRADLRARGAETVARYSWDAAARGVASLLAELSGPR